MDARFCQISKYFWESRIATLDVPLDAIVGTMAASYTAAIVLLVATGVIDTPDYWKTNYNSYPSLGALLCDLGGAISIILPLVLVLMVVTNIIVEVLKGLTWGKLPTNILAFLVAMAVTLLAFVAVCQIAGIPITWYVVVGAVVLGIFVAYAAMFGFDKLKQTIQQLNKIKE